MAYLREKFDDKKLHLDDLCNLLTEEITNLSTAEYKLRVAYVLMHIIEESQKALLEIDTSNFVTVLKEKIDDVCKESEKQKDAFGIWFTQNKQVRDIIDNTNYDLLDLDKKIDALLAQYDGILKPLVELRNHMSIPEREAVNPK